jgi:hypothetical protein
MPEGVGSLCLTCQVMTTHIPLPSNTTVRHSIWPLVGVIGGVLVAGAIAFMFYLRHQREERLRDQYPVEARSGDARLLDKEGAAWRKGKAKLLAALAKLDPSQLDARITTEPCTIPFDPMTQSQVDAANADRSSLAGSFGERIVSYTDPDADAGRTLAVGPDLLAKARKKLDALTTASARKRFRSAALRDMVVAAVDDPALIVFRLDVDEAPKLVPPDGFDGGYREGVAYAFDRETGELRCAGKFTATSSKEVGVLTTIVGNGNEHEALDRDFEAQTERAIVAAMRAVR